MNLISRRKNVWKSSAVFFHFYSPLHSTRLNSCLVDCIGCHESISKILFVVTLNGNATENKAVRCFFESSYSTVGGSKQKGGRLGTRLIQPLSTPLTSDISYVFIYHFYGSIILVSHPQSFYATTIKICWHYKYQAQPNSSDPRIKSRI